MTTAQSLIDSLPSSAPSGEPGWLGELRLSAASRVRAEGFPTVKTETWQFTPLRPITEERFVGAQRDADRAHKLASECLGYDDTPRLVMANGRVCAPEATHLPTGISIFTASQLLADDPAWMREHLGRHLDAHHFAALNSALFEDGLVVRARRGTTLDEPLHIVHVGLAGDSPTVAHPRVLIVADDGAELCIIETYLVERGAKHLTNAVTEVSVGPSAVVEHIRVADGVANSFQLATLSVHQQANSSYASRLVALGGALCRVDINTVLDGEGARCSLDGTYHTAGAEHLDFRTIIDHASPRCSSNEEYRGLLDGRGHAVFDGTIVVRPDAQQTSAHQQNHNLLLSDDAGVNSKPHLEIDADDVSCSHGATVGALDDGQLFYLRSRGMGETEASALLTFGFVKALLDRIPHRPTADRIANAILDRLPGGEAIRDLT